MAKFDKCKDRSGITNLRQAVAEYAVADIRKATWQIINTFIPYLALWAIMIYTVKRGYRYWVTAVLFIPAAAMLTRIFIIFHDCCHKSFFASRRANTILGYITGILTFTPYEDWWFSHARHHVTFGNLDCRGVGDVRTLTVDEYVKSPRLKRAAYRLYRNPFVMFGLGPMFIFLGCFRYPHRGAGRHERISVMITNLAMLAIIIAASMTMGLRTYLVIQLPCMIMAATLGIWLFYVQHQFEGVYWARSDKWDPVRAALEGSSYYKLPKVLQWITGNIGYHHVHHVHPLIANYNLQRCCEDVAELRQVRPLTVRRSLGSVRLNLWDEQEQKLVSFRSLRSRVGA